MMNARGRDALLRHHSERLAAQERRVNLRHVDAVERFIGRAIERVKLDDFKYTYTTILDEKRFKGVSVRDRKMKTARVGKGQHFGFGGRRRRR